MLSSPLLSLQDPAGIFELVEVVGNGTYGQVYKVGVGRLLCFPRPVETSCGATRDRVVNPLLTGGHAAGLKLGKGFRLASPCFLNIEFVATLALKDLISWLSDKEISYTVRHAL